MNKRILYIASILLLISLTVIGYYKYYAVTDDTRNMSTASQPPLPVRFSHEVVVVLENESYNKIIGNDKMPYLNSLADKYGVADQFYANTHPSIGNYFMMTTGQIVTNDDLFDGVVTDDNMVREMDKTGKTWKVYAESIPEAGYLGGNTDVYAKRHNPFAYFSDVVNDKDEAAKIVPFTELGGDLADNALPDFSFVVPNNCNNGHDCPFDVVDDWLKQQIGPLVDNADFQKDGLLVITFDEGRASDKAYGGGHIPVILIGAQVKASYKSDVFYQQQNMLRTLLEGMDINTYPGAASSATPMSDLFK